MPQHKKLPQRPRWQKPGPAPRSVFVLLIISTGYVGVWPLATWRVLPRAVGQSPGRCCLTSATRLQDVAMSPRLWSGEVNSWSQLHTGLLLLSFPTQLSHKWTCCRMLHPTSQWQKQPAAPMSLCSHVQLASILSNLYIYRLYTGKDSDPLLSSLEHVMTLLANLGPF